MKIKNELVSIKIGNKHYDFNNLILDTYLERFIKSQLDKSKIDVLGYSKQLEYCFIKFDRPIENISTDSVMYNQVFDVALHWGYSSKQTINERQITVEYSYNSEEVYDYIDKIDKPISNYIGRKITAIGFNVWTSTYNGTNEIFNLPVLAVLDTSSYNIYIQENQNLFITRKDLIGTDALFYSNDKSKVPGPAHLTPYGIPQIINQPTIYNDSKTEYIQYNNPGYGFLHSIGLSSYPDYMDKEFIIGQDVQVEQNGTELNIKGLENYLSTDSPLFPSNNIYPSSDLYPIKSNYKYVILKYKVWQLVHSGTFDNIVSTPTDTGYFYYQAIPIEKFGKSNITIKYERG